MFQDGQGTMVQHEQVKSICNEQVTMVHNRLAERVFVLIKKDWILGCTGWMRENTHTDHLPVNYEPGLCLETKELDVGTASRTNEWHQPLWVKQMAFQV